MDIPENILQLLKCDNCNEYLSCGPVYFQHESEKTLCGRCINYCSNEEEITTAEDSFDSEEKPKDIQLVKSRYKQYEAFASLFTFPCKYAEYGCNVKLPFCENQEHPHETTCDYKQHVCPIALNGHCNWTGNWKIFLEHCKAEHPNNIFTNECVFDHDLTTSKFETHLITAFDFLFLLHIKICSDLSKIYHSIRLLGYATSPENYRFKLKMKKNEIKICKPGKVLSEGLLQLETEHSIETNINNLVDIFKGSDEIIYTITIKKITTEPIYCEFCFKEIQSRINDELICFDCAESVQYCSNKTKGCLFRDLKEKCEKHEVYYCNFISRCLLSQNCEIKRGETFFDHYVKAHGALKSKIGSKFHIPYSQREWKRYLLSSDVGFIFFACRFINSEFKIWIRSPLSHRELHQYKCAIIIEVPSLSYENIVTSDTEYKSNWDWFKQIDISQFPSLHNIIFDITININKI